MTTRRAFPRGFFSIHPLTPNRSLVSGLPLPGIVVLRRNVNSCLLKRRALSPAIG
jgi:hypothetical protein